MAGAGRESIRFYNSWGGVMRAVVLALVFAAVATPAYAQYGNNRGGSGYQTYGSGSNSRSNSVDGYHTNRGTYVQPHQRTNPNNTQLDNYNSRGNYNPHSGSYGTKSPRY